MEMSAWRTSETTAGLMALIAEVQGDLKPAPKDATNPHFGKGYASLDSVIEACQGPLSKRKIARIQPAWSDDPGSVVVTTRLQHGEEWIEADLRMPVDKRNSQAVGSATTYGRRYGLSSMLGISVGGDDDGNDATSSPPTDEQQEQGRQARQPAPSRKQDTIGPRCKGQNWPGKLGDEVDALIRDISAIEDTPLQTVFENLLARADVPMDAYIAADTQRPRGPRDLGTQHGKAMKAAATRWLRELTNV